ncbi:MAG: carbohydrate binding family 9 domain-containing protein [bacterium]|nr:carbohydrate binding family 9 domain-containing protein [bacterium]
MFVIIVIFLLCTNIFGQTPSKQELTVGDKELRVPEVSGRVNPDGILNEEVWKKALKIDVKYEVRPGENIAAPVKTEVLLAFSKSRLYVAILAYDPEPSKIRARISDHDDSWDQDWAGVVLDTFNDERRNFFFICNPFGVQSEIIETHSGGGDGGDWDTIWDSGGRITDKGYFVEMSIPFSSLRFQRSNDDQVWGFDCVRSYPRNVRHHIGTFPRDRNNNCYLCQAIKIKGFKGAKPGRNIEFAPTLSGHLSWDREDKTESFVTDKKLDPGITTRWGFTPNLTLNLTVNPDFSQVEADALQMDINEPFALYYDEKRPFFTEGGDFFRSRMDAIYTRALRDPSWGLKLSGKEGAHSIGTYVVRDTITNLLFPGIEDSDSTSLSMDSTATALRYRFDIGNKYTLGTIFTNRSGENYYNRVYGIDGDFRITSKDRVRVQYLGSTTQYPDEVAQEFEQGTGKLNDRAIDISYNRNTRNMNWFAGYEDKGKDFRADLGFITQVGYRSLFAGTEYTWHAKPDKWWSTLTLEAFHQQKNDQNGNLLHRRQTGTYYFRGIKEIFSMFQAAKIMELYNGVMFKQYRYFFRFQLNPTSRMFFRMSLNFGDRIDYDNTRMGDRIRFNQELTYNLGLHLRIRLEHTYERLWFDSQRVYTANQSQLRLVYQLNKRTFLRTTLQYVDYRYNTDMYLEEQDPVYKHLFTQFLFSYKINPQTVLFLGYSDNYYAYDFNSGLPQIDRKFFMKIGYALVL